MNVLQVHNYYKNSGGEDIVVENEASLLKEHGHTVRLFSKSNESISHWYDKLKLVFNTHYSRESKSEFHDFIEPDRPDIVHVHNFFPLISPSIFEACRESGIPAVLTLHNYRLIHPNGLMMHDGEIDNRSLTGSAYQCVTDGVYRDSVFQTAVVAHMIEYHRKKGTWNRQVDLFIALTDFAKKLFVQAGLPPEKIMVKPNFIRDPYEEYPGITPADNREGFLFVGRISEEKGISELVTWWMKYCPDLPLYVIGTGPLRKILLEQTKEFKNITWVGHQKKTQVYEWLSKAKALIFPSKCYEGFPLTILEAFSMSCPVICSNIGSQQAIVKNENTGLHFKVSDGPDLIDKVKKIEKDKELISYLGKNARREYEQKYTPEKNYEMLMTIYGNAF